MTGGAAVVVLLPFALLYLAPLSQPENEVRAQARARLARPLRP
jgi:hypothetical protein